MKLDHAEKKESWIRRNGYWFLSLLLLTVLVISILVAVTIGSVSISIGEVYRVILFRLFGMGSMEQFSSAAVVDVVWLIRLPRLLLAVAVGMGLSICGVIMQAIVKNPLADPYVLGVSSGASLGATAAIMLGFGSFLGANAVGVFAFAGAFGISLLVLLISQVGGRSTPVKLLLAGMALSAVCSAFSSFIIYVTNDSKATETLTYWLMGSLAGAKWSSLAVLFPFVVLGTGFFWTQYRTLNLMLMGDDVSITLGTNLHRYRQLYLVTAAMMIGFVVCYSGMIGFVGLVIPHVVRMILGTDHKKVIPVSALLGGIFLIWADVLCRVIVPHSELPIGIFISMIGAPCFLYLMIRKKYGFGGGSS